ncbi:MAG: helicase HerA-like domain-containing protein [Rhodospirillales bacterium]
MSQDIFVGQGEAPRELLLKFANRHGLIAGATGTGKTVTLQTLAEGFSRAGVPVFVADVKGDLSGISQKGGDNPKIVERAKQLGMADFAPEAMPVVFWDLLAEQGHPIRTTISEVGPVLLSRLLDLNDVQEGVLNVAFKVADDQGLLLLDLKDLRAMLNFVGQHASELSTSYGQIGKTSLGAIQRQLLVLEQQGAEKFFGEPALDLKDFLRIDNYGRGAVNVLAADRLMNNPRLYATFLLWLMSELFENLPEVGDVEKPKLVFFFDEAHLLFDDAPKALLTKIEQVVRLIRSKGVGIYFISQNPLDVPDSVLSQLSNRVQHALRAFTPRDQKAVNAAADTFRSNPKLDVARVIGELVVGEALVSLLEGRGEPAIVQRTLIAPPTSRLGPVNAEERKTIIEHSPVYGRYDDTIDRDSAFEQLNARAQGQSNSPPPSTGRVPPSGSPWGNTPRSAPPQMPQQTPQQQPRYRPPTPTGGGYDAPPTYNPRPVPQPAPRPIGRPKDGIGEILMKSAVRTVGSSIGREIVRGVLGSILKRR